MTYRIEIDVLASGQPRPYADSRSHVRVTFTHFFAWCGNPKDERSEWRPWNCQEDLVRELLPHLPAAGFPKSEPKTWADTRLTKLEKTAPGVWEFHTVTPFTD
jgi:hypothetical protein